MLEEIQMSVYMIIQITILNHDLYARYVEEVPKIIKKHGGRYLVRGGKVVPMFGSWNPERIVLIEFETMEQLRNCFDSPEYLKIAPFRENSTVTESIIVYGFLPAE